MFTVFFFLIGYLGLTMYLANQAQITDGADDNRAAKVAAAQSLLYLGAFLTLMTGLLVVFAAMTSDEVVRMAEEQGEEIVAFEASSTTIFASIFIAVALAATSYIVVSSQQIRQTIQQWIGSTGSYQATSIVHTTAIVLTLFIITAQISSFVLGGGTEGLAESIEEEGVDVSLQVFQGFIQVAAAFLGIGWAIRRDWSQALDRLGLRTPTRDDIQQGIGIGLALLTLVFAYGIIISLLISLGVLSEDQMASQNQAAESFSQAFSTIPLALILSASAAISEEILFRGALQPIFGNLPVSVFFALMHTQNLLSPSVLLIFVVSLALGWLRERQSTTAAIIGHFVYNFVQLLLLILVSNST